MAVFSVLETVSALVGAGSGGRGLNIDLWVYLGVALLSMGAAAILRSVNSNMLSSLTGGTGTPTSQVTGFIPRPVEDDLSSGWVDPYASSGQYGGAPSGQYGATSAQTGWTPPTSEQPTYQTQWGQPAAGPTNGPAYQTGWEQTAQTGYQAGWSQPGQVQSTQWHQGGQWQPPQGQPTQWQADQWQSNQWQQPDQWQQPAAQDPYAAGYNVPPTQPGVWGQAAYGSAPEANYSPWQQPQQPLRPTERPIPQPGQLPQANPTDLEARIADIIRRSRERRGMGPDDDLPY